VLEVGLRHVAEEGLEERVGRDLLVEAVDETAEDFAAA
jgi:hypothetical protein